MALLKVKPFSVKIADEELGVFDTGQVNLTDLVVFENTTKMTINDMLAGITEDLSRAGVIRALVWFMRYKYGTAVDIGAIDFNADDLVVEVVTDPKVQPPAGTTPSSDPSATSTE